ncbi:hypothetical protein U9M48_036802 [Paspalum notatum var. saurae]|uniref:Uncharacterized protein n=1 Tax=Paspalum notatum var. saurae TaxID=547442 RepID=A0AAQ3X9W5_PASNO
MDLDFLAREADLEVGSQIIAQVLLRSGSSGLTRSGAVPARGPLHSLQIVKLLAVVGPQYDTLEEVIGIRGTANVGSLKI